MISALMLFMTFLGTYKVVCYFEAWAWYRPVGGKYFPEDIDSDLCTHVVYAFATLDAATLTIKSHDPWADLDNSKSPKKSQNTLNPLCCTFSKHFSSTKTIRIAKLRFSMLGFGF